MPIPYIVCRNATAAIDFYAAAFGATEIFRMTDPGDGRVGHAELDFAGEMLMLADEYPDFGALSPDTLGGSPVSLFLRVANADSAATRATGAGATLLRGPTTQSFGERVAVVQDPFGHRWHLSQQVEVLTPAEMQRRWEEEGA